PLPSIAHELKWHPDGKTLAVVGGDQKIYLCDVPTRTVGWVLEGHKNGGHKLAFNHAGDLLVSRDWSSTLRFWDVRTGQQVFKTQGGGGHLRFSPDDRLMPVWNLNGNKMGLSEVAFASM